MQQCVKCTVGSGLQVWLQQHNCWQQVKPDRSVATNAVLSHRSILPAPASHPATWHHLTVTSNRAPTAHLGDSGALLTNSSYRLVRQASSLHDSSLVHLTNALTSTFTDTLTQCNTRPCCLQVLLGISATPTNKWVSNALMQFNCFFLIGLKSPYLMAHHQTTMSKTGTFFYLTTITCSLIFHTHSHWQLDLFSCTHSWFSGRNKITKKAPFKTQQLN